MKHWEKVGAECGSGRDSHSCTDGGYSGEENGQQM